MNIGHKDNVKIKNYCNVEKSNYSNFSTGKCYEIPNGIQPDSEEAKKYLAGEEYFTVEEIELYKLII